MSEDMWEEIRDVATTGITEGSEDFEALLIKAAKRGAALESAAELLSQARGFWLDWVYGQKCIDVLRELGFEQPDLPSANKFNRHATWCHRKSCDGECWKGWGGQ